MIAENILPILALLAIALFLFLTRDKPGRDNRSATSRVRYAARVDADTRIPRQYIHNMTLEQMEAGNKTNAARLAEWLKETEEIHPIKAHVYPTTSHPATPKTVPPTSNRPAARRFE